MVDIEATDAIELTELFAPCVNLDPVDEIDGFDACVGLVAEGAVADAPKSRRVDENSREGSRLEDEY